MKTGTLLAASTCREVGRSVIRPSPQVDEVPAAVRLEIGMELILQSLGEPCGELSEIVLQFRRDNGEVPIRGWRT